MKLKRLSFILLMILSISLLGLKILKRIDFRSDYKVGEVIDSYNGVSIYYNGGVDNVEGRNITTDGYNLGLKYQCVEFVKRYYYEIFHHKMPDSYGHAKDFFDTEVPDGQVNKNRNLIQFTNPSKTRPRESDIIIFDSSLFNSYGHVAIVSLVLDNHIEIAQQNPGPFSHTKEGLTCVFKDGKWGFTDKRILGWLRKQ